MGNQQIVRVQYQANSKEYQYPTKQSARKEIENERARILAELNEGKFVSSKQSCTIAEAWGWLISWGESENEGNRKKATTYTWRLNYKNHIAPYLGDMLLSDVDATILENWSKELLNKGVSKKVRNDARQIVNKIFDHGIVHGKCIVNVSRNWRPLSGNTSRRTDQQLAKLKAPKLIPELEEAKSFNKISKGFNRAA